MCEDADHTQLSDAFSASEILTDAQLFVYIEETAGSRVALSGITALTLVPFTPISKY
jgi:hypothetical protein